MVNPELFYGGTIAVIDLGVIRFAHKIAKVNERLDAIGSQRRWSEVEPAGWNVLIVRIIGGGVVLFGLLIIYNSF